MYRDCHTPLEMTSGHKWPMGAGSHDENTVMGPVPRPYYGHGTGPENIIWSWDLAHDHLMVIGTGPCPFYGHGASSRDHNMVLGMFP